MKKLLAVHGILALAGVVIYRQRVTLIARLMERGLESRLGSDAVVELEDGLHLVLCGTGGPIPVPNASGLCVAVVAGKQLFIVDTGTDGVSNLARIGYRAGHIQGVFLTHFHSDHEAAETARDAGVCHLLYYHIVPPLVIPGQKALWLNGADKIFSRYTVGQDGVSFSLPANSDEIIFTRKGL
ncbi:MAG: MBL fold metallo-hydrolase [Gammaproteobacteria bacterium]|nr:MBL fold metallo-hydrolase [Gammaproteobacteria bacterium]